MGIDNLELMSRLRHVLAFLKEEALGALGAIWRPAWWSWVGMTLGIGLLLCVPVAQESASVGAFVANLIYVICLAGYFGVFIAIPVGVAGFLWRLFGWGAVGTLLLAPPAFIATGALLSPWLFELGGDLINAFAASYEQHDKMALTSSFRGSGVPEVPAHSGSPEPNIALPGGGGKVGAIRLAIILIPLAICVAIDLARISFEPSVLWSATWFLGAVGVVLGLAITAALVVSVPLLVFSFVRRARDRYEAFASE